MSDLNEELRARRIADAEAAMQACYMDHADNRLTTTLLHDMATAAVAALARQEEGREAVPRAWVGDMKTSAGMDYYVCVGWPDRYLTPQMHKIRGRAEYDVAEWNHMLGHGPEPDILAFDTDHPTPPIAALAPHSGGEVLLERPARVAGRDFMPGQPVQQLVGRAEAHYNVHYSGATDPRLATPTPPSAGEGVHEGTGCVYCDLHTPHVGECTATPQPAPPSAGEAEWPLFTYSGIAPRKLDALRSQGWSVNGYALYRDGMRGLIDLHGAVHWVGDSPTPTPQAAGDRMRRWAQGLIQQLPPDHDGRNSWLLNYGVGEESDWLRSEHARYKQAWKDWREGQPQPTREPNPFRNATESGYASTTAGQQAAGVSEEMVSAVRFAPTSAYWSEKLVEFFGPAARSGIDALDARIRELTAAGAAPEGKGVALIAAERQRQIAAEGWTPEHDDAYQYHELARAAACYATANWGWDQASQVFRADVWPWDEKWWKPDPKNQLRNLARAGALIAAEIDRLQRAAPNPGAQHGQEGRDHG